VSLPPLLLIVLAQTAPPAPATPPAPQPQGADIRGLVIGDDGAPKAGAWVDVTWVESDGRAGRHLEYRSAKTDESGQYLVRDLPGNVDLWLSAQSGDECSGPPVSVRAGATGPIRLRVSRENTMELGGQVVDERGRGVADAEVEVTSRLRTPEGLSWSFSPSIRESWHLHTDSEGRFQTPRRLRRDAEHSASARAKERRPGQTEWLAPTTPSFFEVVVRKVPPPDRASIVADHDAGLEAYWRGDYAEAERRFRAAAEEAKRRHIADPPARADEEARRRRINDLPALADWLSSLADACIAQGKYADAAALTDRALVLRQEAFGLYNPEVAASLSAYATALDRQGKHTGAAVLHLKALQIAERTRGLDHPESARIIVQVALNLYARGRYDSADELFRRALKVQEQALGGSSARLAYTLLHAARNTQALGKNADAESLYRRALEVSERALGTDHPFVAEVLENYAGLLRNTGRPAEAVALDARAKAVRSRR
jgi:tetratricopeptide (TPR) repeat protein